MAGAERKITFTKKSVISAMRRASDGLKKFQQMPTFEIDGVGTIGYLTFRKGLVATTQEINDGGIIIDQDISGKAMGVEINFALLGYNKIEQGINERLSFADEEDVSEEMIQRAIDISKTKPGNSKP